MYMVLLLHEFSNISLIFIKNLTVLPCTPFSLRICQCLSCSFLTYSQEMLKTLVQMPSTELLAASVR